jgi:type II secretory pathway pseudopilin PulG
MTSGVVVALIGLLSTILAAILRWYLRKRERNVELIDAVISHQKSARLSIAEAEKRAREGVDDARSLLNGGLSQSDVNRVLSGLPPTRDNR